MGELAAVSVGCTLGVKSSRGFCRNLIRGSGGQTRQIILSDIRRSRVIPRLDPRSLPL
ncbi:protein of unknown function [Agreia sp. COWG]|nr:protein of unknown function [Agreia sp. COWG]